MSILNNTSKSIEEFEIDLNVGLTTEQINDRKSKGLVNKLPKHVTKSVIKIIFDNIFNFFNIFLFAIAILMVIARVEITNYFFVLITSANILIGLIQDIHARKLISKLQIVSYPLVKVLRNGEVSQIEANEVVLSDIEILANGDQIISDSIVREGSLEVNESFLTGESNNVTKNVGDKVFCGSYVTGGNAKVEVVALGKSNYAEKLQEKAQKFNKPKSQILNTLGRLFTILIFIIVVFSASYLIYKGVNNELLDVNGRLSTETIKYFSGAAISMIPAGMYLLTSITLSVGVINLARKRMIVQQLYCIEMLARVDVLCFDKTGTLTDGTMTLKEIKNLSKLSEKNIRDILFSLVTSTKDDNQTAKAILNEITDGVLLDVFSSVAFSSERKFSALNLKDGNSYVLGAKEFVPHKDKSIDELALNYEKEGLRVLLLALSNNLIKNEKLKNDLSPIALIVLEDHIKEDAVENINWFKNNGVQIKVISGDNPVSVSSIASSVGVKDADKFISLENMEIDEVRKIANDYNVFGRVSPEQKEALVLGMQDQKHIVAMTGDGVNDILAFKVADCSIAMASGSDATKAVANIVSLDSNFSALPNVVKEGRRVINNLQRTCSVFLVKTFFTIFFAFALLFATFADKNVNYPFSTTNIFIWEFLLIGIDSFFLSLQPNHDQIKGNFATNILAKTVPSALTMILIIGVYFIVYLTNRSFLSFDGARAMSSITFTIIGFIILIRVSYPLDIYRRLLVIGSGVIAAGFMLMDILIFFNNGKGFFNINYNTLTSSNWWLLLIVDLAAIPLFILLNYFSTKLFKKIFKNEEFI